MKNLSTFLLISVLSCGTFAVFASPNEERTDKRFSRMTQDLDLNEQQQKQFRDLMKSHMEKRKALRDEHTSNINAILTNEQQQKYSQLREEKKAKHEKRRAERMEKRKASHDE